MSIVRTHDFPNTSKKRGGGRPKRIDATTIVAFRVPEDLAARLDSWAAVRGLNRNQAGLQLLQLALTPPSGGYNPITGAFQ